MITDRTVSTCLSHPICLLTALLPYEAILCLKITTCHNYSILGGQTAFCTSKLANKHGAGGALLLSLDCAIIRSAMLWWTPSIGTNFLSRPLSPTPTFLYIFKITTLVRMLSRMLCSLIKFHCSLNGELLNFSTKWRLIRVGEVCAAQRALDRCARAPSADSPDSTNATYSRFVDFGFAENCWISSTLARPVQLHLP